MKVDAAFILGVNAGDHGDVFVFFRIGNECLHELSGDAQAVECRMDIDGMLYRVFIGGPVPEAAIVGKTRDLVFSSATKSG